MTYHHQHEAATLMVRSASCASRTIEPLILVTERTSRFFGSGIMPYGSSAVIESH